MNNGQQTVCAPGGTKGRERTRFFPRQLITPDDLTQDQIYFREKMRRHNRLLHGWGVVCGAAVSIEPLDGDQQVTVKEGYILGPYGDEILIDRDVTFTLQQQDVDGNSFARCAEVSDPWCHDIEVERGSGPLYVAVRYDECRSRPVRVKAGDCGCDESACEYSRIRDSFVIRVLDDLPTSYREMSERELERQVHPGVYFDDSEGRFKISDCPECPSDPWVILAEISRGDDGNWQVDNFSRRRFVISHAIQYGYGTHG